MSTVARISTAAVWVAAVGIWIWLAASLPPLVPVHLNPTGSRIASKWEPLAITAVLLLFCAVLPSGLRLLANRRTGRALVNLPHPEYWLAPPRRAWTIDRLVADCTSLLAAVAAFCMIVVAAVTRSGAEFDRLNTLLLVASALFITGFVVWAVRLRRKFARVPRSESEAEPA